MELLKLGLNLGTALVCAWFAVGSRDAWKAMPADASSPGALLLPMVAGVLAVVAIGTAIRAALHLRRFLRARSGG